MPETPDFTVAIQRATALRNQAINSGITQPELIAALIIADQGGADVSNQLERIERALCDLDNTLRGPR